VDTKKRGEVGEPPPTPRRKVGVKFRRNKIRLVSGREETTCAFLGTTEKNADYAPKPRKKEDETSAQKGKGRPTPLRGGEGRKERDSWKRCLSERNTSGTRILGWSEKGELLSGEHP